MYKINNFST